MTSDARQTVRVVVNLAVFAAVVWYSLPGRPPLTPILWRQAARSTLTLADRAAQLSLWYRSHYWKAVRP